MSQRMPDCVLRIDIYAVNYTADSLSHHTKVTFVFHQLIYTYTQYNYDIPGLGCSHQIIIVIQLEKLKLIK